MNASIFDIDGTLVVKEKWVMLNFSRYLSERGFFPKKIQEYAEEVKMAYFQNKISYREMGLKLPRMYATALKDVREKDVGREAKNFVNNELVRGYFYTYTEGLAKLMKGYGVTIGISGAPKEVMIFLGKHLGFDLSYGTELEARGGVYTGGLKANLIIKETKEEVLGRIIKEKKIDLGKAYGFGDTEQDLPILSKVGNPIALNPNKELLSVAQKNGWMIFYPADDVVDGISKKLRGIE